MYVLSAHETEARGQFGLLKAILPQTKKEKRKKERKRREGKKEGKRKRKRKERKRKKISNLWGSSTKAGKLGLEALQVW